MNIVLCLSLFRIGGDAINFEGYQRDQKGFINPRLLSGLVINGRQKEGFQRAANERIEAPISCENQISLKYIFVKSTGYF